MRQPSLAERLGYGPEDRLLIVNGDDLGSGHSVNVATLHAMVHGVATSATLMVPCPWVCLTGPAISDLLDQHKIKRISFRALRHLQRAS